MHLYGGHFSIIFQSTGLTLAQSYMQPWSHNLIGTQKFETQHEVNMHINTARLQQSPTKT